MELGGFLGYFNNVPWHVDQFLPSGIPFWNRNVLAPNCMWNVNILDHHRTVYDFLFLTIHLKYLIDGHLSLAYRVFLLCTINLYLENYCLFLETVFISTTTLSVGLYQWSPDSCILNSMFGFSWSSLCTNNIWSMLSYVTWYLHFKMIKRETLPTGEDKAPTTLPQSLLHTETGVKKRRLGITHDRTY